MSWRWLVSKDLSCHGDTPPSRALMQGCGRAELFQASCRKSMEAWFLISDTHLAVFSKYNPIRVVILAILVCIIVFWRCDLLCEDQIPLNISQGLEDAYLMSLKCLISTVHHLHFPGAKPWFGQGCAFNLRETQNIPLPQLELRGSVIGAALFFSDVLPSYGSELAASTAIILIFPSA